jgi:uncharacterized membrane protein YeaQ/YmgE (transglycosylase-associated protein family)
MIGTLILGGLVGFLAKLVTVGRDLGGFVVSTLLGIAGAFSARFLGQATGWRPEDERVGLVGGLAAAVLILVVYHGLLARAARMRRDKLAGR